jgi:hypothetical protein
MMNAPSSCVKMRLHWLGLCFPDRALQPIDLMATVCDRAFSLLDLMRATGSNFVACHAVLTVLIERAYLVRDQAQKIW